MTGTLHLPLTATHPMNTLPPSLRITNAAAVLHAPYVRRSTVTHHASSRPWTAPATDNN